MPSVFKLYLWMKRTRPRALDGKPSMICPDAAGLGFFSGRRVAVPAGRSLKCIGAEMNPANALAATTAGDARDTNAWRSPMRPLEVRLVALDSGSPFFTRPRPRPRHAPQPGRRGRGAA